MRVLLTAGIVEGHGLEVVAVLQKQTQLLPLPGRRYRLPKPICRPAPAVDCHEFHAGTDTRPVGSFAWNYVDDGAVILEQQANRGRQIHGLLLAVAGLEQFPALVPINDLPAAACQAVERRLR